MLARRVGEKVPLVTTPTLCGLVQHPVSVAGHRPAPNIQPCQHPRDSSALLLQQGVVAAEVAVHMHVALQASLKGSGGGVHVCTMQTQTRFQAEYVPCAQPAGCGAKLHKSAP